MLNIIGDLITAEGEAGHNFQKGRELRQRDVQFDASICTNASQKLVGYQ